MKCRIIKAFAVPFVISMLAICLMPYAITADVYAEDNGIGGSVIYDAADFASHSGRTKAEVMQKYTEASAEGTTYINGRSASYYDEPVSTVEPYAIGVLSSDTLAAMRGMSNFYRWLIGVEPLATNTESDESMQAQAFDRNFQHAHYIDNSSKPANMDQALWDKGYYCNHNILAWYSAPVNAITAWLNEGYRPSEGRFDTVGHRTAILSAEYSSIIYGFSGTIAIGKCGSRGNTFTNAFASFPAAGPMPSDLIYKTETSWTVQLNPAYIEASDDNRVEINVENLTTGESYTCTTGNGKAEIKTGLLNFVQPTDAAGSYYTDSYKVTATGLTDVSTGKDASITYTVEFFDLPSITSAELPRTKYAYTGSSIEPELTISDGNKVLTEGGDYQVIYHNNVDEGIGIAEVRGIGAYCGVIKKAFKIEEDRKDIRQSDIDLETYRCYYDGTKQKPAVEVVSFGRTLEEGKDYELDYADNIEVGKASVTIKGIGEYSGAVTEQYTIDKGCYNVIDSSLSARIIEVGDTAVITATAGDNAQITFESLDETIATVDSNGVIHGLSDGYAVISIMSSETDHYYQNEARRVLEVSKDIHTMVDVETVYADENNDTATVRRKCSVCGKEETNSFKTISRFTLLYWDAEGGISDYIEPTQTIGNSYEVSILSFKPRDAEDESLVLESSDPGIMTADENGFTFKGTGKVTLKVYAKYRPSAFITHTFTVVDENGNGADADDDQQGGGQTPANPDDGGQIQGASDIDDHTSEDPPGGSNQIPADPGSVPTAAEPGIDDHTSEGQQGGGQSAANPNGDDQASEDQQGGSNQTPANPGNDSTAAEPGIDDHTSEGQQGGGQSAANPNGDDQISGDQQSGSSQTSTNPGSDDKTSAAIDIDNGETPITGPAEELGTDGTALGTGASFEAAEAAITGMTSDNDLPGSVFSKLQLRSKKQTKTSITLSWKNVTGAKKYIIYGNKCGKKTKPKKLATVKAKDAKTYTKKFRKVAGSKINKGTYYKFMIVAIDKDNKVVSSSKIIHVATKGGKVGNVSKVTTKAKKNKVSIRKGKKFKLAGKQVAASKKLKVKKHRAVTYETTNPKVAKVSKKSVITGKKKGSCYVYAYAQNGVYVKIRVTVR